MSLLVHLAILVVLIVDLAFAATVVDRLWGRWAAVGFEFALILGYVLFVLQMGAFLGRRDDDDRS